MNFVSGLGEVSKGLGITLKNFFKKPVTVQYPEQLRNFHPRFRGAVAFVRDKQTGKERCVGCGLCSAICPANCLTVVPGVDEHGIRNAKIYLYDMSRCVFCGMCVEVCPELALVMTHEFELATNDRSELVLDAEAMLKLADKEAERTGHAIEDPGFPAVTTLDGRPAESTLAYSNKQLDTKIQTGNHQSHQPLLGTLPHGYPMPYKDYLAKKEAGKPLALGNLPPHLREIQNNYLPEGQQTALSETAQEYADEMSPPRTKLITASDTNQTVKRKVANTPYVLPEFGTGNKSADVEKNAKK
jgi:NADH-quinone oxidoreductase subunit I